MNSVLSLLTSVVPFYLIFFLVYEVTFIYTWVKGGVYSILKQLIQWKIHNYKILIFNKQTY